jgi:hypothetical protein
MKRIDKMMYGVVFLFLTAPFTSHAQGPNAPEAASFEPVDATDMVNLVTGDFTYVLPLLNVPSPEGGYPLALAYHAGIAMDQEASWVGLGWNLNSGALTRSVNGYPDDYNSSKITEYFYDEGDEIEVYSLSLGYGTPEGSLSVGLGFSWGSHKSLGGFVSIGFGLSSEAGGGIGGNLRLGSDGVGFGVGVVKGGLSLGVSASSNGTVGGSIGFNNNSEGFRVTASSNGTYGMSFQRAGVKNNTPRVGVSLSSSGIGFDFGALSLVTDDAGNYSVAGAMGVGLQLQFSNTVKMGDYTTKTGGWMIPIMVPTNIGVFSLTFGKQTFRYYLGKKEMSFVNGPLYFDSDYRNSTKVVYRCTGPVIPVGNHGSICGGSIIAVDVPVGERFMDIYTIPVELNTFSRRVSLDLDHITFPNFDKYNVQAQGLSGSISSRLFENGILFGLKERGNSKNYFLKDVIDGVSSIPEHGKFDSKPNFYFENEISSYLNANVSVANFNINEMNENIFDYYESGVNFNANLRRRNGTYIECFTNKQLIESYEVQKNKGYLKPIGLDLENSTKPPEGIGAFQITAMDGKTYHYSLPVYNHEIVTRTFGAIADSPLEKESYFEKRQLEPYATHWLLTAVTGPDYFDTNDNGIPDKQDYGYWVCFEYGQWSDAFAWKTPYGTDYFKNEDNAVVKTAIRGRKQVYYLDKIKTRTHAAIFVKSEREDAFSEYWKYESVAHINDKDQTSSAYTERFTIPSQKPLRLDRIILVKEEDDTISSSEGVSDESSEQIIYNDSDKSSEQAWYNLKDNVIDEGDDWKSMIPKALSVIEMNYDYTLAKESPNTNTFYSGRLTLNSVNFKGKEGLQVLPPYEFEYYKENVRFEIDKKDDFGYYMSDNSMWSLEEIKTPQGGKIEIDYETNLFQSVMDHNIIFRFGDESYSMSNVSENNGFLNFAIKTKIDFGFQLQDTINFGIKAENTGYGPRGSNDHRAGFKGVAEIIEDLGDNQYVVRSLTTIPSGYVPGRRLTSTEEKRFSASVEDDFTIEGGGIRVASLTTSDETNSYLTKYTYGKNESGIGYISYMPFAPELQKEVPYSAELPAPKVMYEYVQVESTDANGVAEGSTHYRFKILKEKDTNVVKFGDLYEIEQLIHGEHYNEVADKDVFVKSYTVKDNLSSLGQLLEVSTFNKQGHLLSRIENQYYAPGETPNLLGVTKESYQNYRVIDYSLKNETLHSSFKYTDKWFVNSSSRIKYPSLLKKSIEYKGGHTYSSDFGKRDTVTGKATEIISVSSSGVKLKNIAIPAYYKYSQLGTKVDNIDFENMLTQGAANYTYLMDPITKEEKVISANITTWNNTWDYLDHAGNSESTSLAGPDVWRKHKEYVWDGAIHAVTGAYEGFTGEDDGFDWTVGVSQSSNSKWKSVSETTRYSHFSAPLEVQDINGNKAATKMGDHHSKIIATANAGYTEMFYSGGEYVVKDAEGNLTDYFDGEVGIGDGILYNYYGAKHTGDTPVTIRSNEETFVVRPGKTGRYKASVWAYDNPEVLTFPTEYVHLKLRVGGTKITYNTQELVRAGDWVLLRFEAEINAGDKVSIVADGDFTATLDDFRLHPIAASMTSYVYNEWDELTYMMGPNGLATKYVYDSQGRLQETWQEVVDTPPSEAYPDGTTGGFKIVSQNEYNYKNR